MLVRLASAAMAAGLLVSSAAAETINVDFETPTYSLGVIHLQDGWSSSGAAGSGCGLYDHRVVTNTYGYASFEGQSLRMSNAVATGCFGDQTFSKSLANDAGETTAVGGALSGGLRQSHFEAEWDFASTQPLVQQPGLSVVASPDRGDGARMSWIQMADGPGGLEVNFYDYQDLEPYGSDDPADGCADDDNFFFTPLVTNLDRTIPHRIKVSMDFVEGDRNDVVKVWVDGVLLHQGTSWEDYFRYCEGNPTRPVDSILFRTGGGSVPSTMGKGFVIDNLGITSAARPIRIDLRPANTSNQVNTGAKQLVPVAILAEAGFDPVNDLDVAGITMRGASPLGTKTDVSDVNGDGLADLTVYFRARDLEDPTEAECADPDATITLEAVLTESGATVTGTDDVTWLGC